VGALTMTGLIQSIRARSDAREPAIPLRSFALQKSPCIILKSTHNTLPVVARVLGFFRDISWTSLFLERNPGIGKLNKRNIEMSFWY
jgi:hypothetical protein